MYDYFFTYIQIFICIYIVYTCIYNLPDCLESVHPLVEHGMSLSLIPNPLTPLTPSVNPNSLNSTCLSLPGYVYIYMYLYPLQYISIFRCIYISIFIHIDIGRWYKLKQVSRLYKRLSVVALSGTCLEWGIKSKLNGTYMLIYIYGCIYEYAYIYIYMYIYVCAHMFIYFYIYICMHIYTGTQWFMSGMGNKVKTEWYIYVYIYTYIYIYVYIYMYMYT
jgi:hypothetical protein